MRFNIDCPCCGASVIAVIAPPQKEIRYPNDKAQPGYPAVLEDVEGCGCFAYLDHLWKKRFITGERMAYEPALDSYEQEVFEAVDEEYPPVRVR